MLDITRLLLSNCGIRLIGLPAPSGRSLIGDCLPFPLAGQPFHRFHKASFGNLVCLIVTCQVDVPFLLCSQGSRLAPLKELQFYMWAEFPHSRRGNESHTPTRQSNIERHSGSQ